MSRAFLRRTSSPSESITSFDLSIGIFCFEFINLSPYARTTLDLQYGVSGPLYKSYFYNIYAYRICTLQFVSPKPINFVLMPKMKY